MNRRCSPLGVLRVWRVRQSDNCYAAELSLHTSSQGRRVSSCSRSRTEPMQQMSPIPPRRRSRSIRASRASAFVRQSPRSSRKNSSRSLSLAGLAGRLVTESLSRPTYGQLGNPYLGAVMGNYCARNGCAVMGNSVATKVITPHVSRSAVAVRALPSARRSLRSLCELILNIHGHRLRWSFPPSGGGGGERFRDSGPPGQVPACPRLRPLPRPLADDDEPAACSIPPPGWLFSRGISRLPAHLKYARGNRAIVRCRCRGGK